MWAPREVIKLFNVYTPLIEREIKRVLDAQPDLPIYDMLRYFFGFMDEKGNTLTGYGGKRFRPGLCLFIADAYGDRDAALLPAVSIEIFHNFTLIHDDIEDHDELRRGRPTVWKVWGVNHAINAGDAGLILAQSLLPDVIAQYADQGRRAADILTSAYREVIEGQFLDFSLADKELHDAYVSEDHYYEMIHKKAAVLVGVSAEIGGLMSGASPVDTELLRAFGVNLGVAYQIHDDMVSLWGAEAASGKEAHKDIHEKKKTLPILYAYKMTNDQRRNMLQQIFAPEHSVNNEDIAQVIKILEDVGAYAYARQVVEVYAGKVKGAIEQTTLPVEHKKRLVEFTDALLPSLR